MSSSKEARPPVIHWFRKDLRLADNPALSEAAESGRPVATVYILEDGDSDPWPPGGAGRWWLHHSLASLDDSLRKLGNRLILRRGRPGGDTAGSCARDRGGGRSRRKARGTARERTRQGSRRPSETARSQAAGLRRKPSFSAPGK